MEAAPGIDQADESTFLSLTPGDWLIGLWLLAAGLKLARWLSG